MWPEMGMDSDSKAWTTQRLDYIPGALRTYVPFRTPDLGHREVGPAWNHPRPKDGHVYTARNRRKHDWRIGFRKTGKVTHPTKRRRRGSTPHTIRSDSKGNVLVFPKCRARAKSASWTPQPRRSLNMTPRRVTRMHTTTALTVDQKDRVWARRQ